ncbi:hypothetical protein DM01DRAFT_1337952 [Hesseltinella vesiculosa]|uniref:Uncharacterized protein n=1 Tax=Hesseltinella vesiculosa TaxID=101127 RepID=A0A1X2GCH5_9FUNG|nr:hypothetical protein DM01DRAFT_1337952 [Hesseltinella vesiculosa]
MESKRLSRSKQRWSEDSDKRRGSDGKRKSSSRPLPPDMDPFAGMKTSINYQQEIERLKSMVPKASDKKHPPLRPKSMSSVPLSSPSLISDHSLSQPQHTPSTIPPTPTTPTHSPSIPIPPSASLIHSPPTATDPPLSAAAHFSSSSSSSSSTSSTSASSISSASSSPPTSNTLCTPPDDAPPPFPRPSLWNDLPSAVSDEEKTRFLNFMRSWTGGHWNGWHQPAYQLKSRSEPCSPLHDASFSLRHPSSPLDLVIDPRRYYASLPPPPLRAPSLEWLGMAGPSSTYPLGTIGDRPIQRHPMDDPNRRLHNLFGVPVT